MQISPKSGQRNKRALTCTKSSQKKCKSQPGSEHIPLVTQKHAGFSPFQCFLLCTHLKRSGKHTHSYAHTLTHTLICTRTHTHTSPSDRRPDVHPAIGFNQTLTHAQIHQEKRLFQQKRLPVRNNRRVPHKSRSCV